MGHVYADVMVRGARGEVKLKNVVVDTGASYTTLPIDVIKEANAWPIPHTVSLELGDGRIVKADTYAVIIGISDRTAATIVVGFEGAKTVIGVRTLEDLGLKVDPVSGRLEPTRPKGLAYFYLADEILSSARQRVYDPQRLLVTSPLPRKYATFSHQTHPRELRKSATRFTRGC